MSYDTYYTRILSFIKDVETNCFMGEEEKEALVRMTKDRINSQYEKANESNKAYLERCHKKLPLDI